MLNEHFEAEKNGDENSTMLHYVRLGSNLKSLQFDEDTGPVPKSTFGRNRWFYILNRFKSQLQIDWTNDTVLQNIKTVRYEIFAYVAIYPLGYSTC